MTSGFLAHKPHIVTVQLSDNKCYNYLVTTLTDWRHNRSKHICRAKTNKNSVASILVKCGLGTAQAIYVRHEHIQFAFNILVSLLVWKFLFLACSLNRFFIIFGLFALHIEQQIEFLSCQLKVTKYNNPLLLAILKQLNTELIYSCIYIRVSIKDIYLCSTSLILNINIIISILYLEVICYNENKEDTKFLRYKFVLF